MSAPQIPHLNSLRRGNLKPRGRGSGTREGWTPDPLYQKQHQDDIIRNTDSDAATSRLSAIEAGYLDDPFAKLLGTTDETPRRLPLMNRGTYVRTTAIDRVVETFITSSSRSQPGKRMQIISLGAGSDTRFFRLRRSQPELRERLVYHELDFESNTRAKIDRIRSPGLRKAAREICGLDVGSDDVQVLANGSSLRSDGYCIHPIDLRTLARSQSPLSDVDITIPTLLISECCLVYLSPHDADAVLAYFASLFPTTTPLAIVIYEPIRPHDAFGRTMVSNLTARGIVLQTVEKYKDLLEQRGRLREVGLGIVRNRKAESDQQEGQEAKGRGGDEEGVDAKEDGKGGRREGGAEAADIDFIWKHWISDDEKERVEKLEWMDEVEEFVLLGRHYCLSWGWRGFRQEEDEVWRCLTAPGE